MFLRGHSESTYMCVCVCVMSKGFASILGQKEEEKRDISIRSALRLRESKNKRERDNFAIRDNYKYKQE